MPMFRSPPSATKNRRNDYSRRAGDALQYGLKTSAEIRDIGPPPEIGNPEWRDQAIADLEFFLRMYFPNTFTKPFSRDHQRMIQVLQDVATEGGLSAFAMPRGQGKTQISLRTSIWAVLSKRRNYVAVVGATTFSSRKILKAIKIELTYNRPLYRDFPRELHGLPQLQGDNRKALKQLCEGIQTHPRVGTEEITFPTIPGSNCSGAHISTCGITGNIRGQFQTLADGTVIRPDFVIPDDCQTRESAKSALQTNERLEILNGDIMGLAGPGIEIACAMPCTVIVKNDLADQTLQNTLWQSVRTRTLYSFPKNLKLWDTYFEFRAECRRTDGNYARSNQMYRDNQTEMDAGADVAWAERYGKNEISAIQSAMHLWRRNPTAFAAEYQNEPEDVTSAADAPTFAGLMGKLTRLGRGIVPRWATWLTVGIDVQKRYLLFVVLASCKGFKASVVDYGAWPEQSRSHFTRQNAYPTLQTASGSSQDEGALVWGMRGLFAHLFGRVWQRDQGGEIKICKGLIDAADGNMTDTIYQAIRESEYNGIIMPTHGYGRGLRRKAISEWTVRPGEQMGHDWITKPGDGKRRFIPHAQHDVNAWRTFMARRVMALAGESGSLSMFGENPEQHQMFSEHLASTFAKKIVVDGRPSWFWEDIPNSEDECLDGLVMAGVAASMAGATLDTVAPIESNELQREVVQLPSGMKWQTYG